MSESCGGDICVLRANDHKGWIVSVCRAEGRREFLKQVESREEAAEFALAERDRRRNLGEPEITIHMPDDCPCYRDVKH